MTTLDDFLEARVKDDTEIPLADAISKHHIIGIYRALDTDDAGTLNRDAWTVVGEILRILALRYKDHPDYNPAWAPFWTTARQQPAGTVMMSLHQATPVGGP
jgi:hypothetical protein